ncbi:MAG: hypothetical protein ACI4SM_06285 [Candidatus Gastranaerophilaceae bacterium]
MQVNSVNLAQNLLLTNRNSNKNIAFRGETPSLDSLREKQDEFRRMSEQSGSNGLIGKLGNFATKAIGVIIAFTATKICLDKAANMIGSSIGKYLSSANQKAIDSLNKKAAEKVGEEATKLTEKATKLAERFAKSKGIAEKAQNILVNVVAGGAAVGVAMKDFGLVKKEVSSNAANLVDNAIDKASENEYNHETSSFDEFGSDDKNDEF